MSLTATTNKKDFYFFYLPLVFQWQKILQTLKYEI